MRTLAIVADYHDLEFIAGQFNVQRKQIKRILDGTRLKNYNG